MRADDSLADLVVCSFSVTAKRAVIVECVALTAQTRPTVEGWVQTIMNQEGSKYFRFIWINNRFQIYFISVEMFENIIPPGFVN